MRKLSLTLLAALIPLVAASLALGGYLNYAGVRHNYLDLVGGRMSTVAHRVANDAEVAMSMGVPLASQDVMNQTLEREAEADPMILSVDVISSAGTVLFSSAPDRRGMTDAGDRPIAWRHTSAIDTPFGTNEGEAVVRASQQALDHELNGVGRNILWLSIAAALAGIAVIAIAVVVNVRTLFTRLTARAATRSGALVPQEIRPHIAAIDEAHAAVAARLGLPPDGGAPAQAPPLTGAGA